MSLAGERYFTLFSFMLWHLTRDQGVIILYVPDSLPYLPDPL